MDLDSPTPSTGRQTSNVIPLRGTNRDDNRTWNLSLVLHLVHRSGALSRADITKQSGLNRSTVAALVAELVAAGLVVEREPVPSQSVGRPSPLVAGHPQVAALAFSPRRRAATLSAVGLGGRILGTTYQTYESPPDPYEMAVLVRHLYDTLARDLPSGLRLSGIGADLPGQVHTHLGYVTNCEQLDWVDAPFVEYLERTTSLKAYIDNDSNLACSAELDFGAGREFQDIIYLYGGEGAIGGGVVVGGRLLRGSTGYAGELGHMRISDLRTEDTTGLRGTLEALVRRQDLLAALRVHDISDDQLEDLLATSRSPRVIKVLQQQIDYLAIAISNLVNIFNPQAVLLAGYLPALYKADDYRLLSQIRVGSVTGARERVVIRTASLGSAGLAVGAAELAFGPLLQETTAFQLVDLHDVV